MDEASARGAANLLLVSAGLAAAYVVFTRPPLRRLAARGFRMWLGATVPVYLITQIRRAWVESAPAA